MIIAIPEIIPFTLTEAQLCIEKLEKIFTQLEAEENAKNQRTKVNRVNGTMQNGISPNKDASIKLIKAIEDALVSGLNEANKGTSDVKRLETMKENMEQMFTAMLSHISYVIIQLEKTDQIVAQFSFLPLKKNGDDIDEGLL